MRTFGAVVASTLWLPLAAAVQTASAQPVVLAPLPEKAEALVSPGQKAYLDLPLAERRRWLVDTNLYARLTKASWRPRKVRLAWMGAVGPVSVCVSKGGKSVFEAKDLDASSIEVGNLEVGERYEWSVRDAQGESLGSFMTEDYAPRLMDVRKVPNFRDLGGRRGLDGRRVRQGLLFRSAGLNDNAAHKFRSADELTAAARGGDLGALLGDCVGSELEPLDVSNEIVRVSGWAKKGRVPSWLGERYVVRSSLRKGAARLDGETCAYLTNALAIRTDVDLRTAHECFGMDVSPLGPSVRWEHHSFEAYGALFSERGKSAFREAFKVFLARENYPIVFHCISGADRTGTLAAVLNGLLGVAEDDIYKDWETTAFHNTSGWFSHKKRGFDGLVKGFERYPGQTLNERMVAFVKSLGFTDADLARFRDIMLEPKPLLVVNEDNDHYFKQDASLMNDLVRRIRAVARRAKGNVV